MKEKDEATGAYDGAPRFGWLPGVSAVLSVLACYGTLGVVAGLSLIGVTLAVNVRVWAAIIVALAAASAALVALNALRSRRVGPLAVAVAGASLVAWVMFVSYSRLGEVAGFALLLSAALCEHRQRQCNAPSRHPKEGTTC
ncbi:MAG: hypothetical protein M1336_02560 [Deltaproteobacteria bacterium]|jgi:hypothetical protein|nr:hypothetical protein [Deltaproteobacteria bacterium]